MQGLISFENTYTNLIVLISTYAKYFAVFIRDSRNNFVSLHCVRTLCEVNLITHYYIVTMEHSPKTIGRMELAQLYFPYILPRSAWQKLKSLLVEDPALKHLVSLKRRSFLPVEVNIIYQKLGHP